MKKIEINKKWILIICICFAFCAIAVVCGVYYWDSTDDELMNLISVGAFGDREEILFFTNILYGFLLKALYAIVPVLNWYLIVMLLMNTLAIALICRMLSERFSILQTVLLTILINLLLAKEFYVSLQFTKNAALYAVAGFLACYCYLRNRRSFYLVHGIIFLVLGIMTRTDSFLLVLPFGLILLLLYALENKTTIRRLLKTAAMFFVPVVLVYAIDILTVNSDKAWKDYREWLSISMLDYGAPSYEGHEEEYEALGIDELDLKLYTSWEGLEDKFTIDVLREMNRMKGSEDRPRITREVMKKTFLTISETSMTSFFPLLFLMIVVIICFIGNLKRKLCTIGLFLMVILEYWYLCCLDRVVWRAELGIWISALFMSAMMFSEMLPDIAAEKSWKEKGISIGIAALFTILYTGSFLRTFQEEKGGQLIVDLGSMEDFIRFDKDNGDKYYFVETSTMFFGAQTKSLFTINKNYDGFYDGICALGGWAFLSPLKNDDLEKHGIKNRMQSLAEDDNVYLVCYDNGWEQVFLEYLRKEYNPELELELISETAGRMVWNFKS